MCSTEIFIKAIEDAKMYVKGELELDCIDGIWIAMDYRENLGGAFPIEVKGFNNKMITVAEAKKCKVNVRKCCDICRVAYVG